MTSATRSVSDEVAGLGTADSHTTTWLPTIEALRAVAASAVVVHHLYTLTFFFVSPSYAAAHPQKLFPGWRVVEGFGNWGVDLFFLLSGFLLCDYFWRPAGQRPLRGYYIRRFFRIAPAYYANIALLFLFFADHKALFSARGGQQVAANATFLHWFFPSVSSSLNVNGALWTLSIEVALYALMPLLALAVAWRPVPMLLFFTGLGLGYRLWVARAGGPLVEFYFHDDIGPGNGRLYLVRQFVGILPIFMAGIAARWFLVKHRWPRIVTRPTSRPSMLLLVLLFVPSWALLDRGILLGNDFTHWVWFTGFDFALALLLLPAVLYAARPVAGALGWPMRAATWLGRRSYGLYLWHFPVILSVYGRGTFVRDPDTSHFVFRAAAVFAISIGLATASYAFIEQPALEFGRRLARGRRRESAPTPA